MAKFKIHFAFSQNSFHVPLRWLLAFPKNKQRKTWVNTQRKEMEIYLLNKFWRSNFPIHLWVSALPEKFPKFHLGKESCSHFFWHLLIFSLYFLFITALRSINICFGNASNSSFIFFFFFCNISNVCLNMTIGWMRGSCRLVRGAFLKAQTLHLWQRCTLVSNFGGWKFSFI